MGGGGSLGLQRSGSGGGSGEETEEDGGKTEQVRKSKLKDAHTYNVRAGPELTSNRTEQMTRLAAYQVSPASLKEPLCCTWSPSVTQYLDLRRDCLTAGIR